MARIIPEKVYYFNKSYGEKLVYESLKSLSDDYTIFYSVLWQQKERRNENIVWGESDFTVFHPKKGILVIEVKSGGISYKDGKWWQTRLDNNEIKSMKDPLIQANKSKYRFISVINEVLEINQFCNIESVVWFPSIVDNIKNIKLPLSYNKDIIFTQEDLKNPENAINKAYQYYNAEKKTRLDSKAVQKIISVLAPEFDLIKKIDTEKQEKNYAFLRLTREQSTLLDYLIEQKKVCIQGSAGTGKTLIAIEEAKRLALDGRKVLFLCFNHFLYKYLKSNFENNNIDFYNLHTLLFKYSGRYDIKNEEIVTLLKKYENKFDYNDVIIDEAQDFNDDVIEFYSRKTEKCNGKFFIFYDRKQLLFQKEKSNWIENAECKLVLSKNCRNTQQIAITSNSIIDANTYLNDNAIQGEMPTLNFVNNREEAINKIKELIDKYKSEGFENKDIIILTLETEDRSILNAYTYINNNKIVSEIDGENILFTTSKKFKGLESDAVIIIDIKRDDFIDEEKRRNLYVASSRARQKLGLVFESNDEDIDFLAKEIKEINNSNGIAKIAMKLKVKPIK